MLKKTAIASLLALSGIGLSACDVDKTQEGKVTVPKYEVDKTQEGSVTPPKYEVTPPDVKVTESQRTIEVPKVETEKKTVEVPKIEVEPAKENDVAKANSDTKQK